MSVFHGTQGKGAMRRHREERYRAAVGRQQLMHDAGRTGQRHPSAGMHCRPAPVEEFLDAADRAESTVPDYRPWTEVAW